MARTTPEPVRFPVRVAAALLLGLLTAASCAETTTLPSTIVHPTLIEVSPDEFMHGLPCLDAPGAMQLYVATVYDLGPPLDAGLAEETPEAAAGAGDGASPSAAGFALPSSGPVNCVQPVGFAQVVPGNRYTAVVQAYDRRDLVQFAPGVPILVDPVTGQRVEPRWTSSCGGDEGTICHTERARTIGSCTPLEDSRPSDLTAVQVRIDSVLGSLTCGEEPGQVSRFEVEVEGGERLEAACGQPVLIRDVALGTTLLLPVFAYEAGAEEPSFGTTCTASPAAGALVSASCTALTDRGGVDVSPLAVLEAYGLDCSALGELSLVKVFEAGEPIVAPATPRIVSASACNRNVRFGGTRRGQAKVQASLVDGNGVNLGSALCSADIVPNQAVLSACSSMEP